MVKEASQYSYACSAVNQAPSNTVIIRDCHASFPSPFRSLWCDQVRETPEERRMAVFRRGTPQGCIGVIPVGGHVIPISAVGERALWKKAQKKLKKNMTSDNIKSTNPILMPRTT